MTDSNLIYFGAPYSHDEPIIKRERLHLAFSTMTYMMRRGCHVISPLTGVVLAPYGLPDTYSYWREHCREMLSMCNLFVGLDIAGWESSEGFTGELEECKRLNVSVIRFPLPQQARFINFAAHLDEAKRLRRRENRFELRYNERGYPEIET